LYLRTLESEPLLAPQTAVTAFVGVAERGPLHVPQPVRNWGEYLDVFGGSWGHGFMADSVYAFFLNGGEKAYAVRVGRTLPEATRQVTMNPNLGSDYPAGSVVSSRGFALEVTDGRRVEVFDNLSMRPANSRYFVDVINSASRDAYVDAARKGHSLLVRADPVP